ncbi:uncharacterized protein DUF4375 [Dysgonomonas alginatilytica]|uniref:Uncharacterized protein DUF4375 n=1 Tax=Dysgonomonas alginatilytica TaxID=1605892 RepID=A0A2V3PN96_9BACT|nr:DMP19 family protein [Dysgonomonas alginatilytica]PXV63818.1 uncharacterized protein DUF4375 [Dysgonomonas alginatilytica]
MKTLPSKLSIILLLLVTLLGCKQKNENNITDKQIEESVRAFENRTIYKKLTKEIIDSANDNELEMIVYDNICSRFNSDYSNDYEVVKGLSKGQQAIYSIWWVEAEVNNGGFNQFYFNSSGKFAEMAIDGFKVIGANKFADLMIEANKIYNENKEILEGFDDGTVESFSKSYEDNPLDNMDQKFYEIYNEENLSELRITYIRKNYTEFI